MKINHTILVIGSSNTDMVVKTERFPKPGETIIGGQFFTFPGGKGANQAVAAARLGAQVVFICKVGTDVLGQQALDGFKKENINIDFTFKDSETASGVALITVNQEGENEIVVAPGANHQLSASDLDQSDEAFQQAGLVLLQLETSFASVEHAIHKAHALSKKVVLNPAPGQGLPQDIYSKLFLITPNETEAEILTKVVVNDESSAEKAADQLLEWGVQNVVITLGAKGAFFKNKDTKFHTPAPIVNAVDTTAAGDVFNGAICVALAKGKDWREAIAFACQAAAISVTRLGAQSSAPHLNEITP